MNHNQVRLLRCKLTQINFTKVYLKTKKRKHYNLNVFLQTDDTHLIDLQAYCETSAIVLITGWTRSIHCTKCPTEGNTQRKKP